MDEERRTSLDNAMQLLWKELNHHLDHCLSAGDDSIQDFSSEKGLEERETKVHAMERVWEANQKILEQRSLDLDSKERDLMEMERKTRSQVELHLREKKLPEKTDEKIMKLDVIIEGKSDPEPDCAILRNDSKLFERSLKRLCTTQPQASDESENKIMRVDLRIESPGSRPDWAIRSNSAEKLKGIERNFLQASGTARRVQVPEGLGFWLTIRQTHEEYNYITVPASFFGAYDMSNKKYVILSTDKDNFRLGVRHCNDSRQAVSRHVRFTRGWRYFYCKNLLNVGMKCQFVVKEHTVNGDTSVFSMKVSVFP